MCPAETVALEDERVSLVLALACTGGSLNCFLSDGRGRFDHAVAAWPPLRDQAPLPPALLARIVDAGAQMLRLQVDADVDDWPWEAEVAAALAGLAIARFVINAPVEWADASPSPSVASDSLGCAVRDDPQCLRGPGSAVSAIAWRAQTAGRPSLALSEHIPAEVARAFQLALQSAWGPEPWLSAAAVSAAHECDLERKDWRLYGDMRFTEPNRPTDAQWRLVTSVSIDVVKSVSVRRKLGTERYAESHNEFYGLCRSIVEAHGGRLDDPQGDDGMVAYFGLRPMQEDATAQGVRAAWSLLSEVAAIGLSIRIGVATGRLALDSQRHQFGEEIFLAARLQAKAPPGGMLISEHTHRLLGPGVVRERLPARLVLDGFDLPQVAYRVIDLPKPQLAKRTLAAGSPYVGRERERGELEASWFAVQKSGSGQYRCLIGEAGIGKSRLLWEFERCLRADGQDPLLIRVAGRADIQASTFSALMQAVQAPGLRSLSDVLQRVEAHTEQSRPLLAQQVRERLFDDLVSAFEDLARQHPVCCIVDDAQWLDPSTAELVERLRAGVESLALLLVVSLRDDRRGLGRGLHAADAIRLDALDLDEADELICALPEGASLPAEVRRSIAVRAAGLPLFLEEMVRMVAGRDVDAVAALQSVPDMLEEPLLARLDALGSARPLALLAAVLGAEFHAKLWEAVLDEPDDWIRRAQAGDAWQRLLDSRLLKTNELGGLHYRFRHALLRDAAYESLWTRDRRRLHAIVARVLDRLAQRIPGHLELRAHHLAAAGDLPEAYSAWALAARRAAEMAADRESLALSRRALALVPELDDTHEVREQALQMHLLQAGRFIALDGYGATTVESAYLRAAALCNETDDDQVRTRVDLGLEACYAMRGDLARARALAESAVRHSPWQRNPRLALQARWAWVNVVFHQGELVRALEMADQCLARYDIGLHHPGAVQDPAIMCLCYSAWGLFEQGKAGEAQLRVERALALAQALDHPFSLAVTYGFAASNALFCGRHADGMALAEEAVSRCRTGAFQAWLAHALIIRGRLRAALGNPGQGLAEMEQGLKMWNQTGARITSATYLAFQAEVLLEIGEPAEALRRLEQARQIAASCGERYHEAELCRLEGLARWRLQANAEQGTAAQALLKQALDTAREQAKLGYVLRSAQALADTWALRGRRGQAITLLSDALRAVPDQKTTADAIAAQAALRSWGVSDLDADGGSRHVAI